jgi:protein TonB
LSFFKNILSDKWNSVFSESRNKIVFAKRNKEYGAYPLRKGYFKTVLKSYLVAIIIIFVLIFTPTVIDFIEQIKEISQQPEKDLKELPGIPEIMLSPPPRILPEPDKPKGIPAFIIKKDDKDSIKSQTQTEKKDSLNQALDKKDSLFIAQSDSIKQDSLKKQMDSTSLATNNNLSLDVSKKNGVLTMKVDSLPEFPGGELAMNKYLDEHLKYTLEATAKNLNGTVYVSFIVKEDGGISSIKLIAGIGSGLDDLVIKSIRAMPKWKPGIRRGKPQRFLVYLPVSFYLKS